MKNIVHRHYGFDLLRILSMMMIITLHYCNFGYGITKVGTVGYNTPILWLLFALGYGAVNLYVLISGYFLCESELKWKKVLHLWLEVIFYSLTIGAVFYFFKDSQLNSVKNFVQIILPITCKTYWFISIYFVMYILSPFLNKFVHTIDKKEFQRLLIILGICFFILNEFVPGTHFIDNTYGYGILWFVYLYFVACYIRMYDLPKLDNKWYLILYILLSLITFFSRVFIRKYMVHSELFRSQYNLLYSYNSITVFGASLALFMFFKNTHFKEIFPNIINMIALSTFGVYLIHDNFLIRNTMYTKLLHVTDFATCSFGIKAGVMIVSILGIFFVCSLIDLIRMLIFKWLKI